MTFESSGARGLSDEPPEPGMFIEGFNTFENTTHFDFVGSGFQVDHGIAIALVDGHGSSAPYQELADFFANNMRRCSNHRRAARRLRPLR